MPRRADLRLAALLAGGALLLAGCSAPNAKPGEPVPSPTHVDLGAWDEETSGNGLVLLDGPGARAAMLAAMREQGTVTMKGDFTGADGRTLQIEVTGSADETVAAFTVDDATTTVVIADGQAYVSPSNPVAAAEGLPPSVFSCVTGDSSALTRWTALLHPLQTVASYTSDAVRLGTPVDGSVDLVLGAEGTLGAVEVRSTGPALPSSLTRADASGALRLTFTGWGDEVAFPDLSHAEGC